MKLAYVTVFEESCCKLTCNMLYVVMDTELRLAKSPDQKFAQDLDAVSRNLSGCEQTLIGHLQEMHPRDKMALRHSIERQKVRRIFKLWRVYKGWGKGHNTETHECRFVL